MVLTWLGYILTALLIVGLMAYVVAVLTVCGHCKDELAGECIVILAVLDIVLATGLTSRYLERHKDYERD